MSSKNATWKKYIYQAVNQNHPKPTGIEEFYELIEANVELDEHDLIHLLFFVESMYVQILIAQTQYSKCTSR